MSVERKKTTVYIQPELLKEFLKRAIDRDLNQTDALEDALRVWLTHNQGEYERREETEKDTELAPSTHGDSPHYATDTPENAWGSLLTLILHSGNERAIRTMAEMLTTLFHLVVIDGAGNRRNYPVPDVPRSAKADLQGEFKKLRISGADRGKQAG